MLTQATDTQTMEVTDAPAAWREVLDRVRRGETRVLVAEGNAPIAALISAADFDRFQRWEAELHEDLRVLERSWAAFADVSEEELEREVKRALANTRAEHRRRAAQQSTLKS